MNVIRCLVELSADVNKSAMDGSTPLTAGVVNGHLGVVQYLVQELGAGVNKARLDGTTPLIVAATNGHVDIVRCLVVDLGADVNQAANERQTPLMAASYRKHTKVIKLLIKLGADAQASSTWGTAAHVSKHGGAPAKQTEYLEGKAHCSNPWYSGAGLKKCTGCKKVRYSTVGRPASWFTGRCTRPTTRQGKRLSVWLENST